MRKLITILFLVLTNIVNSQSVDSAVKTIVDDKIEAFGSTLQVVYVKGIINTGVFDIDTLPDSPEPSLYQLSLTGLSGSSVASAMKFTTIYGAAIKRDINPVSFSGITGASWRLVKSGNYIIVRVTGIAAQTKWIYKRTIDSC
jgi:hypothetical protein